MNQTNIRAGCALILLAALAGCSSSPNESDIRAALIKQIDNSGLFAASQKDAFAKVKLVGCTKAEIGGYKCDIAGDRGVASIRFVKADGVWAAVNER